MIFFFDKCVNDFVSSDALVSNVTKQLEVSKNELSEKIDQIESLQQMLRNSQGTNDALKVKRSIFKLYWILYKMYHT